MSEKKEWALSSQALQRLLTWLGAEGEEPGQGYLAIRRRLVDFFDRRNCATPDELTDEVLNRVARRLEEEGTIHTEAPAKYCYVVARFVLMEHRRETQRAQRLTQGIRTEYVGLEASAGEDTDVYEKMLVCLERCTVSLPPRDRDLIIRYYAGTGRAKIDNRRALARQLGITANALSIRACRIRDALYQCVGRCFRGG